MDAFLRRIGEAQGAFPVDLPIACIPPFAISGVGGSEGEVLTLVNGIAAWSPTSDVSGSPTFPVTMQRGDLLVAGSPSVLETIPASGGGQALFSDLINEPPGYRFIVAPDVVSGIFTNVTWHGNVISTTYTQAQVISISGTANRITITGTATVPIVNISTSYVGQASITTLGTITTGVWNGTVITTSFTQAQVISISGTSNRITIGGTATNPTVDIAATYVGQTSIVTLGTVTTGIWNAGAVTSSSTVTATTEVITPSIDTGGAVDLVIQRNNSTKITVSSAFVTIAATSTLIVAGGVGSPGNGQSIEVGGNIKAVTGIMIGPASTTFPGSISSGTFVVHDGTRLIQLFVSGVDGRIGTETNHDFTINTNGLGRWNFKAAGHLVPDTNTASDNVFDLGASATRVRTGYFGTSIVSPLFGTITAADVIIQRNSVAQLTLASLAATFAGTVTATEFLGPTIDSGSATNLIIQRNNATIALVTAAGFEPGTSATFDVGAAANLWRFVYCQAVVASVAVAAGYLQIASSTPAQFVANTDNFALGSFGQLRVSSDASRNLTGITGGGAGRQLRLINVGSFNIVIVNDATSTAANRFLTGTGADITMLPLDVVSLEYDLTAARWRVVSHY